MKEVKSKLMCLHPVVSRAGPYHTSISQKRGKQPRQGRPDSSPRRKPWVRRKNPVKAPAGAAEPWRSGILPIHDYSAPTTWRAFALPPHANPTLLSLLPELLWLLCQSTHGLRRGLGSNTATAVKRERVLPRIPAAQNRA